MSFVISDSVNPPTVFLAELSEMTDRFDPEFVLFRRRVHEFGYPVSRIRGFLREAPQYGAAERGIERSSSEQPRYIRITDIDENGVLTGKLGATAENVEPRYLLEEDDLLVARSGSVGKSYLHKRINAPYPCFFAGYLIRLRFKSDQVLPEYVFGLTQLAYYKEWVRAVQRIAVQANINAQEYANLEIPIPPLTVQKRVVALLQEAYAEKGRQEEEAHRILESIDGVLLAELGIERFAQPQRGIEGRIFRSRFRKLSGSRWDPNYSLYMSTFLHEMALCPFPVQSLRGFVALVQYGISERATQDVVGVPMLRMLNLQDGAWDLSDMKYIAMDDRERAPYLLQSGDILFNRTNSKELVGKCNVFDLQGEYVFASYLVRVRLKNEGGLRPEYTVIYLGSSLGRLQIDAVSRQIAGMANVNAEEIRDLLIPVPPVLVQDRICERVAELRQQAAELRAQAATKFEAAKKFIESLVLGVLA